MDGGVGRWQGSILAAGLFSHFCPSLLCVWRDTPFFSLFLGGSCPAEMISGWGCRRPVEVGVRPNPDLFQLTAPSIQCDELRLCQKAAQALCWGRCSRWKSQDFLVATCAIQHVIIMMFVLCQNDWQWKQHSVKTVRNERYVRIIFHK